MSNLDAFSMCNACDSPINTPNPMGYCDKCLAESKAETEKELAIPKELTPPPMTETDASFSVTFPSPEWDAMVKREQEKERAEKANRTPRPWLVYYCPSRKPGTLSYEAKEISPEGIATAGMAWKPLLQVTAPSRNNAIEQVKERITEIAKKQGKTYADLAERLSRRY